MADERMMSAVTMVNISQPNRQKVNVVMALTQVRAFYFVQNKPRVRTFSLSLSLPMPAIQSSLSNSSTFSEQLLCRIDNDEGQEEAGRKWNYDKLEDVDLRSAPPSSSAVLPVDADEEIELVRG